MIDERIHVKKLLVRILILFLPIIVCGGTVLYADPFNYFNVFRRIPESIKKEAVYSINAVLWNTIDFAHAPSPNIIVGDSRSERISLEHLKEKTGKQYKHLAASAGKLNEISDLFWFANSYTKPESVYIVLNFNMYNLYAYANRVSGAEAAIKNPLLYLFDRHVVEASYFVLMSYFLDKKHIVSKPFEKKDDFWAWSLENWPRQQYGKWKYPVDGYKRLRDISDYCRKNNIELVFIITPHHVDYQKKVNEFNLGNEQILFKRDISALSSTYDFDISTDLTMNKDNFSDPVHLSDKAAETMIDEILTGNLRYGIQLSGERH